MNDSLINIIIIFMYIKVHMHIYFIILCLNQKKNTNEVSFTSLSVISQLAHF